MNKTNTRYNEKHGGEKKMIPFSVKSVMAPAQLHRNTCAASSITTFSSSTGVYTAFTPFPLRKSCCINCITQPANPFLTSNQ